MAKSKTVYVCSDCGSEYAKWQGQCNDCGEWNTLSRLSVDGGTNHKRQAGFSGTLTPPRTLGEVSVEDAPRVGTTFDELDRVLGGGLVPGSVILISGNPGAGKSTLLLQVLCALADSLNSLYITGEESLAQIGMRARRLKLPLGKLKVMSETSVETICATWDELKPSVIVIDSIQVMHTDGVESAPGGVAQVRESASVLIQQAKRTDTVLFLVGM